MSTPPDRPARVVFLDRATLSPETTLRPLAFPHELVVFERTAPDEVAARVADADIVITNKAPVRGTALDGASRLRLVAVAATGTDVVDVAACTSRGVVVSNINPAQVDRLARRVEVSASSAGDARRRFAPARTISF